jgi:hypothetical protein
LSSAALAAAAAALAFIPAAFAFRLAAVESNLDDSFAASACNLLSSESIDLTLETTCLPLPLNLLIAPSPLAILATKESTDAVADLAPVLKLLKKAVEAAVGLIALSACNDLVKASICAGFNPLLVTDILNSNDSWVLDTTIYYYHGLVY